MQRLITIFLLPALLSYHAHSAVYRGNDAGRILVLDSDTLTHHYEDERLPFPLAPGDDCPAETRCYRTITGSHLEQRGDNWRIRGGATLAPYTPPVHDPANRLFATELPYEAALLDDLTFTPSQTTAHNDNAIKLQYWREPVSGLEHFLMADGYPAAQREALNQYLRAQALNTLAARRECLAALPADKRAALQYRTTITPTLTNDRYLSQHIHEENNCGTPYSGDYGITYSIAAGRGLELEDLLWLGDTPPHPLADDNPADQAERERRAQWLLATLKTVAPQTMQNYPYQPHHYLYPYFYLTPQGVYIGPLLPARAAAHAHPAGSVIPYGEIKKHPGILGEKTLP